MQVALEKIVKKALKHSDKYNIPKLECELQGHHLKYLHNTLYLLGKTPLCGNMCSYITQCSNPVKEPPSVKLTRRQQQIKIDIDDKIRHELRNFPKLNFLGDAFDDYFKQIEKKNLISLLNNVLTIALGTSV